MNAYWDAIRQWLWVSPWWHASIVIVPPVAISTILGLRELHHSKEANRLRGEANRISEAQRTSAARIAEQQEELTKLQAALNKLQAERNESLGQIAIGVKKDPTPAEKNAAKLR